MSLAFSERKAARRVRESLVPIDRVGTARQMYRAMLEQQIAPQLREWGFTGDGETFEFPSGEWFLRLAFVPASWNTVTRFQFDVNVMAVSAAAWGEWRGSESLLPDAPDAAMYYAHDFESNGGIKSRLGEFQRGGTDRRWTVYDDVDPSEVAADVLSRIHRHVLPQFASRAQVSTQLT